MSIYGHLETNPRATAGGRPRAYVRPSAILNKVLNPITVALGGKTVLVVRGRKSGKLLKVPMDPPFAWNGTRYLVSPRGETHWARNLRAAGEADLRARGRRAHAGGRAPGRGARRGREDLREHDHLQLPAVHGAAARPGGPPGLPDRADRHLRHGRGPGRPWAGRPALD